MRYWGSKTVILAKAGIQNMSGPTLDASLRWHDKIKQFAVISMLLVVGCSPKTKLLSDTLHIIVQTVPESLESRFASSEVASHMSELLFAPLFVRDDMLLPKPYLAAQVIQPDAKTYLVTLRKNLFFHNGEKLEAKDVIYTYLSLPTEDVRSPKLDKFKFIESIRALSDHVIEFRLKRPYAPFLDDLTGLGIVSKKQCLGRTAQCRQELIGSGPYLLKSYDSATETWEFEAFEGWFEGKPHIPKLEFRVVRDNNTRLLELIKGKADLSMGNIRPFQLPAFKKYPNKLRIQKTPGLGYMYLAMNLRKSPLSDVRVRRAISMAINTDAILAAKFQGMATRATGMLPDGHWAKGSGLKLIPYNPDEAKQLLKQTGLKLPLRLQLIASTDRFRQSFSLIYQQQLREIGIELDIRIQDWATTYQNISQGNFDLVSAMWIPVVEPNLFEWVFHSSNIPNPDKAGGNRGAFVDSKIDHWIEEAQEAVAVSKRQKLYSQIEHRLLKLLPYVPLWFEDNITVSNRRLVGFEPDLTGSFLPLTKAKLGGDR